MPYASVSDKRLVPFVFAVTGHRLLRDEDRKVLRARLLAIFDDYHKKMPNTPLVLLSGMAEGADQLAAECAFTREVSVIAVLPMPLTIYRKTMSKSAAENLDRLIKQTCSVKVILAAGVAESDIAASEEVRADRYDDLGKYLAFNSQIMLALWDGEPSEKKGGTAKVVDYVLQALSDDGVDPTLIGSPQTGVVYHLLTPRSGQQTTGKPGRLKVLIGAVSSNGSASRVVAQPKQVAGTPFGNVQESIERFNQIANLCRSSPDAHYLVPGQTGLPASEFLDRIDAICAQADAVSRRASKQRKTFLFAIIGVISLGTLWYSIADEVHKESLGLWLVLPVTITIALAMNWFARRARIDDLYVDARAISETLRVQYFWQMACITERAVDHYLPHHVWQVDWVRCALRNLMLLREDTKGEVCSSASLRAVLALWIEDQRKWYFATSKKQHSHVERGSAISKWALFAGLAFSTLIPLTLLSLKHVQGLQGFVERLLNHWQAWLHVPGVVVTIFAGGYRLWIDQSGFIEQSREYDRIGHYLVRQEKSLQTSAEDNITIQKVLIDTGIETLQENARWILLHRERPLDVVGA